MGYIGLSVEYRLSRKLYGIIVDDICLLYTSDAADE